MMGALALALVLGVGPAAVADDDTGTDAGNGGFLSHLSEETSLYEQPPGPDNVTPVMTETSPGLDELFCTGTNWTEGCLPEEEPPGPSAEQISEAFAFTPLPASTLIIQPPNGRTLVNFATNFYTDAAEEQVIAVPLGPLVIELRVWPAQFTWHFGDGESRQTTERGAAYPALEITHEYLRKGPMAPSLDTTYAAQWRLQGQGDSAWQPVLGTVTIEGAPTALEVVTATPTLVG